VKAARQQRLVVAAEVGVPVDAHSAEVDAVMARRDAIVALIEKQVAARGEAQVLY